MPSYSIRSFEVRPMFGPDLVSFRGTDPFSDSFMEETA